LSLSQAEGFGLPIVEAASFGTTVIASRIRPFIDLPVNDIHFVNVGDSVGLSELLLSLVENNTKVFTESISRDNNTSLPSWTDWSNKLFKENF
jgi:glycosyltransferase involved in cell wall biosynthesis